MPATPTPTSLLDRVAAEAGVSPRTVQRVLAGRNKEVWGSSARRAAQVRAIAQRLSYKPNDAARAMSTGRFDSVALLLSTCEHSSYLPGALLAGIHEELRRHDLNLTVARLPDEQLTSEGFVPRILRQALADGLLIDYTDHIPPRMIELIRAYRVPSVWINSQQDRDDVSPDDFDAAQRAARHLLELGHRRIAYLDLSRDEADLAADHYSARARLEGCRAAMRAAGLEPHVLLRKVPYAQRGGVLHAWLEAPDRPTAVLTYAAPAAVALAFAAAHRGLHLPRDLSLATFADHRIADPGVALTTWLVPQEHVGREAVRLLRRRIDSPTRHLPSLRLPFGFEPGQSCGRPS